MDEDLFPAEDPVHQQQLKAIAAALQVAKAQSDSVTWVPETIPSIVRDAVQQGLKANEGPSNEDQLAISSSQDAAGAADFFSSTDSGPAAAALNPPAAANTNHQATAAAASLFNAGSLHLNPPTAPQQQLPPTSSQQQAAGAEPSPAAPAVVLGSLHWRSGSSSKRVDWVVTTCLVPDGMPTAAAAEEGGGLAALEVVCRVLVLQDCQPSPATPGLAQALKRVKWQEFGLAYKDFYSCTATDDPTGLLTLGVLPDAVVAPLAMIVCSCIPIMALAGLTAECVPAALGLQLDPAADGAQPASSQHTQPVTDPAAASTAGASNNNSRKRKRDSESTDPSRKTRKGTSRSESSPQIPNLSTKREKEMYVAAFEAALTDLKQQLPAGYLQGKLEALVTACLPSISSSLANILLRVSNPSIREDACHKLKCQPLQLQQQLLTRLQAAAGNAIAAKSQLAASRKQQRQQQQGERRFRAAAAAAAVAAGAGDGMGGTQNANEQEQPGWEYQPQEPGEHSQQQQQWQQQYEHEQQQGMDPRQDWERQDQQLEVAGGGATAASANGRRAAFAAEHEQQQHQQKQQQEPWQHEEQQQDPWQQQQDLQWQDGQLESHELHIDQLRPPGHAALQKNGSLHPRCQQRYNGTQQQRPQVALYRTSEGDISLADGAVADHLESPHGDSHALHSNWHQEQYRRPPSRQDAQQQQLADQHRFGSPMWQQEEPTVPAAAHAALQPEQQLSSHWGQLNADEIISHKHIWVPGCTLGTAARPPEVHLDSSYAASRGHGASINRDCIIRKRKRFSGSAAADLF